MTAQRRTAGAVTAMAVATGAAIETAAAQAPDDLYVLQIHYEIVLEQETGTGAVAETIRETGTRHVSPDGRIRWDRRRFTVPDDYTRMESPNPRRRAVPR